MPNPFTLSNIKEIAYSQFAHKTLNNSEDLIIFLKNWWVQKYNLPANHQLLLNQTIEELLIEYYFDVFKNDKDELAKYEKERHGGVMIEDEEWFKQELGEEYIQPQKIAGEDINDEY